MYVVYMYKKVLKCALVPTIIKIGTMMHQNSNFGYMSKKVAKSTRVPLVLKITLWIPQIAFFKYMCQKLSKIALLLPFMKMPLHIEHKILLYPKTFQKELQYHPLQK